MTTRFPQPGDLFEDRYRIDSVIGAGGFAKVYGATQIDLERPVAIKVLSRGLDGEDSARQRDRAENASLRFGREARLVSQLRDPNTITVFDFGETEQGLRYIVFERVDGRSLKEILSDDGAFEPERVVNVLRGVLSSLEEAHELGILHRDIKPANIMLYDHVGREGVKLLDFGIAKLHSTKDLTASDELTREGALVGTPRYMPPEQIRDQEMTPASDLFSLGLVAYEMLIGEMANPNDTPVTVIGRQLDHVPFVMPWREQVPLGLRSMVHRLLEKDPRARPQSAAEALADLEGWDLEATDATVDIALGIPDAPTKAAVPPEIDELEPPQPALPRQAIAVLFLAIGALCIIAVALLAGRSAETPQSAPSPTSAVEPIVVAVEPEARSVAPAPPAAAVAEPAAEPIEIEPAKPAKPRRPTREAALKPEPTPPEPEAPASGKTTAGSSPSFFSMDDAL